MAVVSGEWYRGCGVWWMIRWHEWNHDCRIWWMKPWREWNHGCGVWWYETVALMSSEWKHECVAWWTKPWWWWLVIYNRGFDLWWYRTVAVASGNRNSGFGVWLSYLVNETVAVVSGNTKPWLYSLVNEWPRKEIKPVCGLWPVLDPCGLILCWHWNRDFTAALITPHNHLYLPHNAAPHLSVIYIGVFHTHTHVAECYSLCWGGVQAHAFLIWAECL